MRYTGLKNTFGLPLLRQFELEDLAAALLYEFDKGLLKDAFAYDCEKFVKLFAHNNLNCAYLSELEYNLGFVAFDSQTIHTLDAPMSLMRGDIVVEKKIVDSCDIKMYRYAIIHLFAHWYLHSNDEIDNGQIMFDLSSTNSKNYWECSIEDIVNNLELNDKEGQADYFACALLMPKNVFKLKAVEYMKKNGINRASLKDSELEFLIDDLSEKFQVPKIFVLIRLKKLNFI